MTVAPGVAANRNMAVAEWFRGVGPLKNVPPPTYPGGVCLVYRQIARTGSPFAVSAPNNECSAHRRSVPGSVRLPPARHPCQTV